MKKTPEEILKKHLIKEGTSIENFKYLSISSYQATIAAMNEYKHQTRQYNLLRLPFDLLHFLFY